MSDFNLEVHLPATRSDAAIIRLTGSLDSLSMADLEKTLRQLVQEKRLHIIVSCQRLKFVSSAGMGLFLGILGEIEKQGGSLSFAQIAQPEVHDAMSLLGLFDVFPVFDQEADALKKGH